ncbi:MAG: hypothetical protein U5L95_03800 [Candidatus Saccharibacteria bacterium]|nr:hypothetical protein [Candidatus Saccharibacteria bacterium]
MNENETSFQATASVDNEDIIAWTAASDIESVLRNSSPQIGEAAIAGAVTAESAARREDVKTAILSRLHDLNTDLEKKQATIDTERQLPNYFEPKLNNSVLSRDVKPGTKHAQEHYSPRSTKLITLGILPVRYTS